MPANAEHPQRDESVLVVWSYSLDNIIPTCKDFEEKLIQLVWKHRSAFALFGGSTEPSTAASDAYLAEKGTLAVIDEQEVAAIAKEKDTPKKKKKRNCGLGYWVSNKDDVEKSMQGPSHRPHRLFSPFYNGLGAALATCKFVVACVSAMLTYVSQTLLPAVLALSSRRPS